VLEVGSIVGGRLRIDQVLGAGGMGVVAAATHLELGHRVAVKLMRDELAENPTIVERFIREARAVVQLRTEHVCRVFDVGRLDSGAPYIVMELLEGADLQRAIAKRPLPAVTAVDYMLQACVALAEAHAAGIVHRDLKPANLFVTRRIDGGPLVKVLDFGIAKARDASGPALTHAQGLMGSPGYMSPEQLQSARDVDARTDIWALGVTLYQLVTARMPFAGPTLTEIAVKVAADPPAPLDPGFDPGLGAVIMRCLEKLPERRYPTVAALAADLVRFASSDGRRTAALAAQLAGGAQAAPAPLPVVAPGAPTAASIAASVAPQAAAAAHTPAAMPVQPRSRWPLVAGALLLVGATVAITLALGRSDSPAPAVSPPAGSGSAVAVAIDAAAVPVAPVMTTGAADPWRPADAGIATDAAIDAPGEPTSNPEQLPADRGAFPADLADQMHKAKAQARESCEQVVKNKQLAEMPQLQMQLVMCWCVLGDKVEAQKAYARMTDESQRRGAAQMCAYYGTTW
jgi:serine/threonine-protein kinase